MAMYFFACFASGTSSSAHVKRSFDIGLFDAAPCDSANTCILHQDAHVLGPYDSLPAGVVLIDCSVTFFVHEPRINMTAEPSMEPSNLVNFYLQQNIVAKTNNIRAKIKSSSC